MFMIMDFGKLTDEICLAFSTFSIRSNNKDDFMRNFLNENIEEAKNKYACEPMDPGQPERSVYGSKRIKNGYFMLTRYFSYTEIHLRPGSG